MKHTKKSLFSGLLIIVFMLLAGGSVDTETTSSTGSNEPKKVGEVTEEKQGEDQPEVTSEGPTTHQVGDKIELNDAVLTVNSFRKTKTGGFMPPKEGKTYLVVNATIENKKSETITNSTMLNMYAKDEEGIKYSITLYQGEGSLDGEILANDKLKGEVAFEVPETAEGLKFYYDNSVFTQDGVIIVELKE